MVMNAPMEEIAIARRLLATPSAVALGTMDADGGPFVSYVTMAPDPDGAPLLLLSQLAAHTRNIARDPRASMLLVEPAVEDMAAVRLTITGTLARHDDEAARQAYLSAHPSAARYAGFTDFGLYRMQIAAGHLVAGFGRIVALTPDELLDLAETA